MRRPAVLRPTRRATAAAAEVPARRHDAVRTRPPHLDKMSACTIDLGADKLAGQRAGNIDGASRRVRDAVALRAEPGDFELGPFTHRGALRSATRHSPIRLRPAMRRCQ